MQDLNAGTTNNDGSVDDAVLAMPDIEALEQKSGREIPDRGQDGRFQGKQPETKTEALKVDPTKADTRPADVAADDDDDVEIEIPAEEDGKQPARLKLSDVLAKYQRTEAIEKELAEVKARPNWTPPEVEHHITQALTEKQKYAREIADWKRYNQPEAPDETLINPNSPTYDPQVYWGQRQRYERLMQAHKAIDGEAARVNAEIQQQQGEILKSQKLRAAAEYKTWWPEVLSDEGAKGIVTDAKTHFGLTEEQVRGVAHDPQVMKVLKAALQFAKGQKAQEAAVKVIKAKPKLVQGSARQSTSPAARRSGEAMTRLRASGSLDDAVAALDGLL